MTVQVPYPVVSRVIDIFGDWLKQRRELREMCEADGNNFGRIASDLRMSSADLAKLARWGAHAVGELPTMLAAVDVKRSAQS